MEVQINGGCFISVKGVEEGVGYGWGVTFMQPTLFSLPSPVVQEFQFQERRRRRRRRREGVEWGEGNRRLMMSGYKKKSLHILFFPLLISIGTFLKVYAEMLLLKVFRLCT